MPEMTTATGAVFIPEVWAKEALIARDHVLQMANRVLRKDSDVKNMGDRINIPEVALATARPVGAGGSINPQAPTETEIVLLVDQWFESSFEITDRLRTQSMYDLFRIYAKRIGESLGVQVERTLHELAQPTANFQLNTITGTSVDIDDPRMVESIRFLDTARAPMRDRFGSFTPGQKAVLLRIDKFVRADAIPFMKGDSPILRGVFGDIYGVQILTDTLNALDINTRGSGIATDFLNVVWQKEAMALALQRQVDMELLARTQLSTPMVGQTIYGVRITRNNHGVVLVSPAASN